MNAKRFRVAFSFAGEKRDFVAKVAAILARRFGEKKILYDKFHEAEFARRNLGIYLAELYHNESDLVVVVICPNYDLKQWTGLEWSAIHDLLSKRKDEEVMLCRFDHATVTGLYSTAGFIELESKTPKQAANLVLERLTLNESKSRKHYTTASAVAGDDHLPSIPNNLPRLPYFFGREADLKKIAEALAEDARGWGALIDGPGGIGKTSLAVRAAELVPHERFRRMIFLSSKERELTADGQHSLGSFVVSTYLEMLNAVARELDQPDLAEFHETVRSDAILRILRDANVLLVLDNLETLPERDRDQLFAFLNRLPRGCSAIVTSRQRADTSAVAVRLDKLDWVAARDLIAELANNNERLRQVSDPERRSLYDETGGNPLLIRWITGQLGLGRCRNITAALDFLRSAPAGNNPVEFIFGDLLDTFTENETQVLAALTHFTTGMEVKFIAELASINDAAAQGALSDLSSRALVLSDLEERRFALVPMVADFLRRKRPEIVAETADRLEQSSHRLIVENGYKNYDRFPVLDEAWPTLVPALPLLAAGANQRFQTVCTALQDFLYKRGHWDELIALSKQAEHKAVAAGDWDSAGRRAIWIGGVHERRGKPDDMLASADRAARFFSDAQADACERAWAIGMRGRALLSLKDHSGAIDACHEAIKLFSTDSTESYRLAVTLSTLGTAEKAIGDLKAAERDYRDALRISHAADDPATAANVIGLLAELELDRERWAEAEALALEAVVLSDKVGNLRSIRSNCIHLASALLSQCKPADALPYAHRAVEISNRLGPYGLEAAQNILQRCEAGTHSSS